MTEFTIWCPEASRQQLAKLNESLMLGCEAHVELVNPKRPLPPLPGGVLLLMGGALADHVRQAGLVKKNASLTSMRERSFTLESTQILVTFDPVLIERESERTVDLLWDLQLAARLATTGSLAPTMGDYQYVDDFTELCSLAEQGDIERVAVDTETVGLDPWAPGARIVSVSITHAPGQAHVYYVPGDGKLPEPVRAQLQRLLCSDSIKVVGANLKYDILWFAVHWNLRGINQTFDTHLVGSLLDENRSNSLEVHAKVYTPMGGYDTEFNRTYDKGRMDLVPKDALLHYAGGDTDACLRVADVQRRLLTKDKLLTRFYVKVLQPAARVFAKVEERGVLVDAERYKELEWECQVEIDTLTKQAFSHVPRRLILKYADNLSLGRPTLIREFLFTKRGLNLTPKLLTPAGQALEESGATFDRVEYASTSQEHLQMFADHPKAGPFAEVMAKYSAVSKTMSTYIVGFQKFIRSDGRFHPTYRLGRGSSHEDLEGGTVTGRLSATDPAYQTIPKRTVWAKPLRTVYPCPEGMGIAKFDFNQGELRIMACLAEDPTMIEAYRSNTDVHSLTAASTMGLTLEQFVTLDEWVREEKRRAAKAINFGLLYGMMPPGLVDYARKSYGVDMSLKQAEKYWEGFFTLYDRLPVYHAAQKKLAHQQEYVRNPLGRVRHLPLINSPDKEARSLAERQAINSRIQSCLSDMMLLAMVEIDRRWPQVWIFGMTHDSVEMYLPLDGIEQQAKEIKGVLENLPLADFGWNPPITFVADAEIARSGTLADVKKLKL